VFFWFLCKRAVGFGDCGGRFSVKGVWWKVGNHGGGCRSASVQQHSSWWSRRNRKFFLFLFVFVFSLYLHFAFPLYRLQHLHMNIWSM
jgi:hypothetical protein